MRSRLPVLFLAASALTCLFLLFSGGAFYAAGSQRGKEIGKVWQLVESTREIIIVSPGSGRSIRMGDRLIIDSGGEELTLTVTYPMMTVAKCKLTGKSSRHFSILKKGMAVYLFKGIRGKTELEHLSRKSIGGIDFIYLKKGRFLMGAPDGEGEDDQHPRIKQKVEGFWISRCEITQKQYLSLMDKLPEGLQFKGDNLPVASLNWPEAVAFCEKFSTSYNVEARLPYEAEWEYACRAGTTTRFYWGDKVDGDYCWYPYNNGGALQPVGTKKPNPWGLYDMSGNAWEWCMDVYDSDSYKYQGRKRSKKTEEDNLDNRVVRVIALKEDKNMGLNVGSADRSNRPYYSRSPYCGFRIVIAPE